MQPSDFNPLLAFSTDWLAIGLPRASQSQLACGSVASLALENTYKEKAVKWADDQVNKQKLEKIFFHISR